MNNPLGVYYALLATADEVDWLDCLRRTKAAGLNILEVSAPKLRALNVQARDTIAGAAARVGVQLTFATALTADAVRLRCSTLSEKDSRTLPRLTPESSWAFH